MVLAGTFSKKDQHRYLFGSRLGPVPKFDHGYGLEAVVVGRLAVVGFEVELAAAVDVFVEVAFVAVAGTEELQ